MGALLPNFKEILESEILIIEDQQLEYSFSILRRNLRSWLNIMGLGANDVSEGRKSKDGCSFLSICFQTSPSTRD